MARNPTNPVLIETCKVLSISDLKRLGFLTPIHYKTGVVSWNQGGHVTGSISIGVLAFGENPHIELSYNVNGHLMKYLVNLVSIPSNLGRGGFWLFVCPLTGNNCRKLYFVDGYFYSRKAFRGCMYEKQTQSHKTRQMLRTFEMLSISEKLNEKHFREYYSGQPTKKYLHLKRKYEKSKFSFLQSLQH